mmetsp:Transcript_12063/g.34495  ORF Transcript_12063/g.34495 Transcript_12063/m.34495 type:complete len:535 (-) Transcript_12063:153-1757(-)
MEQRRRALDDGRLGQHVLGGPERLHIGLGLGRVHKLEAGLVLAMLLAELLQRLHERAGGHLQQRRLALGEEHLPSRLGGDARQGALAAARVHHILQLGHGAVQSLLRCHAHGVPGRLCHGAELLDRLLRQLVQHALDADDVLEALARRDLGAQGRQVLLERSHLLRAQRSRLLLVADRRHVHHRMPPNHEQVAQVFQIGDEGLLGVVGEPDHRRHDLGALAPDVAANVADRALDHELGGREQVVEGLFGIHNLLPLAVQGGLLQGHDALVDDVAEGQLDLGDGMRRSHQLCLENLGAQARREHPRLLHHLADGLVEREGDGGLPQNVGGDPQAAHRRRRRLGPKRAGRNPELEELRAQQGLPLHGRPLSQAVAASVHLPQHGRQLLAVALGREVAGHLLERLHTLDDDRANLPGSRQPLLVLDQPVKVEAVPLQHLRDGRDQARRVGMHRLVQLNGGVLQRGVDRDFQDTQQALQDRRPRVDRNGVAVLGFHQVAAAHHVERLREELRGFRGPGLAEADELGDGLEEHDSLEAV